MWQIYNCLVYQHDYRLVLIAAIICVLGSAGTFTIADRALHAEAKAAVWLALAGICGGASVWSTHFIAMLAFEQSLPISYQLASTLGSLVSGIVIISAGFAVALPRTGSIGAVAAGGATVGAGVAMLHYLGMTALTIPGQVSFDGMLVAVSILFSLTFGTASFHFSFYRTGSRNRCLGLACFVLMVVLLHFTGMGAVRLELGLWHDELAPGISREALAGLVALIVAMLLSISVAGALFDRKRSSDLKAQAERFRVLSDSALEGLIIHRDGLLIDTNAAAKRVLCLNDEMTSPSIVRWFGSADRAQIEQWLLQPSEDPVEIEMTALDGRCFPAEVSGRFIKLADGSQGQVLAFRDITARKLAEARLHHQALHDPLTDLPNRRLFHELAEKVRLSADRQGGQFAIFALDLDGFKLVNDLHGHDGGDRLLVEVAAALQENLREADIVARFGGDEFAIVNEVSAADEPISAANLAQRLIAALTKPLKLDGTEAVVSASIGIAIYPQDGQTISELVRNADTAMYRAKADGKATFRFFEHQMNEALRARHALESRLRKAVASSQLSIAYQPLVDSRTRRPEGFEALVRWWDAMLGDVSPAEFIPIAEETGLVIPIGEYVLRQACQDAMSWPEPLRVAVNLSPVQFRRPGLAETVATILKETGLSGSRLDLEITESILIDNRDQVLESLHALKSLGVRISMDDFGTGYSSLSYLQSFPFDKIKIDQTFVSSLSHRSQSAHIIKAITAMGRSLNMKVVAEGVETEEHLHEICQLSCDEVQGFYIARPMDASQVKDFLSRSTQSQLKTQNFAQSSETGQG